jgi:PAS domain S-box-containing protein
MPERMDKSNKQKDAESKVHGFREKLGPFVVAAETTRMAMVFTDARETGNPIIFANDSFLSLTGYAREEVLGQPFNFMMAHAADKEALAKIEAEFEGSSKVASEIRYRRKNGSAFWSALFVSPVRDENGDIVQYFASLVDLTKHKEEETQARRLIDELNHRVKNTLSTVQSIVRQALRFYSEPKDIRDAIESRLLALSRSHDLLSRENWKSARLRDVIDDALEAFDVVGGPEDRIVIAGEDIRLPPQTALALGIGFNELATNAAKYGAFSNQIGSVLIEWKIVSTSPENSRLTLHWQERNGPPVLRPSRKGFGSRMIEQGLARELEGSVEVDYRPEGVVCKIIIPVPQGAFNE